MTTLRQRMVEELQHRNYSPSTIRGYILGVKQFADYFGKPPDRLGATQAQRFQWYLLQERKLAPGTVEMRMSALRFFFKKVLSRVFRGKFCAGLRRAFRHRQLAFFGACLPLADERNFSRFLRTLFHQDWVVYSKPPFGGPDHVLQYLARYTHRVAISNHRILSVTDSEVRFRWKDYANHNKKRVMTLTGTEFLRRFLQHVLPKGFPRIRYFGWLANRKRGPLLRQCRVLLAQTPELDATTSTSGESAVRECPMCHGPMRILERLTAEEIRNAQSTAVPVVADTS